MKKVLENGFSIFVYPEGTRNKSNDALLPFYDGAFKLAKDMNVPIVVNTLVGMKKRNNINRFLDMSPGVLDSYIEKPIETENKSVQELKEICIDLMKKRLQA
jgi:1-acyl-sn-glycerol-3-phosphate acyltransferase